MSPLLNSTLAVLFLLLGAGAVAIMLELKGNPKDRTVNTRLIWTHRLLGYGFVALFVFMVLVMVRKAGAYQQELSVRAVVHAALGLLLVPLVAIKIFIVRRQRALTQYLAPLGVTLFSMAFVLSGLTAGHYLLHQSDPRYITVSDIDRPVLNAEIGRAVLFNKCGKCHTFERVFRATKDQDGWTKTINRMAVIDAPNINDFDVKQIIYFLLEQQKQREAKLGMKLSQQIGQTLVSQKCSLCHNLDRVFKASKSKDQWYQTVKKMTAYSGDPKFLSAKEMENIITYLAERNAGTAAAQ
jgi:mono/diheme cytochrome c family protein